MCKRVWLFLSVQCCLLFNNKHQFLLAYNDLPSFMAFVFLYLYDVTNNVMIEMPTVTYVHQYICVFLLVVYSLVYSRFWFRLASLPTFHELTVKEISESMPFYTKLWKNVDIFIYAFDLKRFHNCSPLTIKQLFLYTSFKKLTQYVKDMLVIIKTFWK